MIKTNAEYKKNHPLIKPVINHDITTSLTRNI